MRSLVRKLQREKQRIADKEAAKKMGWPKSLRQYCKRLSIGAESALLMSKQLERN